jgi:hypothetical protein
LLNGASLWLEANIWPQRSEKTAAAVVKRQIDLLILREFPS